MDGDVRSVVLVAGSGSGADFLRRAVGPALRARGLLLEALDVPSGGVEEAVGLLDETVHRSGARLVGGVSLGAHAAASWAAGQDDLAVDGLLLALPAWTGAPDAVAAASASAAHDLEQLGVARVLDRAAEEGAPAWLVEELGRAWSGRQVGVLASALRRTARSAAPTPQDLARVGVPCAVVAFEDDPLHPLDVAAEWVAALPVAALRTMPMRRLDDGLVVLGDLLLEALDEAVSAAR